MKQFISSLQVNKIPLCTLTSEDYGYLEITNSIWRSRILVHAAVLALTRENVQSRAGH